MEILFGLGMSSFFHALRIEVRAWPMKLDRNARLTQIAEWSRYALSASSLFGQQISLRSDRMADILAALRQPKFSYRRKIRAASACSKKIKFTVRAQTGHWLQVVRRSATRDKADFLSKRSKGSFPHLAVAENSPPHLLKRPFSHRHLSLGPSNRVVLIHFRLQIQALRLQW